MATDEDDKKEVGRNKAIQTRGDVSGRLDWMRDCKT